MSPSGKIFDRAKERFIKLVGEQGLADESVSISAKSLSPTEAIGNPESDDYPILKGKERMMEATFMGAKGQAFSDMQGNWNGTLADVLQMEHINNYRRAVFVASMNAVLRHLGQIERTAHCRDEGPVRCAEECLQMMTRDHSSARVTMIGLQPRMVEKLSERFSLNVIDMDADNIGKDVFGVTIQAPEKTVEILDRTDTLLVTGTTLVNGTIDQFVDGKMHTIFYGITIAGAASLLGLNRFCPFGL